MSKEELLDALQYFLNPANGIGAVVYFVVEVNGEEIIKFADIEDNAKNEYLSETFIGNDELHFLNISQADERKNVVYRYDIAEKPTSLNILEDILTNDQRDPFQFNQNTFSQIKGYLITIGNETRKMALYKKHHPINLLKRDRFLLVPQNQRLEKISSDAIALDKSVDFMLVENNLVIIKVTTLERFFGFEQVIRNQAQATIQSLQDFALMEDATELTALAENLTNARKLMRVKSSPVFSVPVAQVINFIKNHPELAGRLTLNGQESRVRLTTAVSKKLFFKLLNDDYLFSQLTELQYDSHAKDKLLNSSDPQE
jgi:hypothetical protein